MRPAGTLSAESCTDFGRFPAEPLSRPEPNQLGNQNSAREPPVSAERPRNLDDVRHAGLGCVP